jgi:hypothetical protein
MPVGKRKDAMYICCLQQLLTNGLTCATFKQNIVRNNHCRLPCCFKHGADVLHKVQLLVAGGCVLGSDDIVNELNL